MARNDILTPAPSGGCLFPGGVDLAGARYEGYLVVEHIERANVVDPSDWYASLRARCPVYKVEDNDPPFYVLTTYDELDRVVRETDVWVTKDGAGLGFAGQGVLANADGEVHRRHRSVLVPAFTNSAMASLRPRATEIAQKMLDQLTSSDEGDFIEGFAGPFPAFVIAELLGVSPDKRVEFTEASDEAVVALGNGDLEQYARAGVILRGHITEALDQRLASLGDWDADSDSDPFSLVPDDVASRLAVAHRRGDISVDDAVGIGTQVLIGGHETTTNLLGLMMYTLAHTPGLLAEIRADRDLIEPFIEETLRMESPTQGLFRTNEEDAEIAGVKIPKGSKLQLLFASGNRDEEAWEEPDKFKLDRPRRDQRRHLAFGRGNHVCIGAPLARMEAVIALNEVLDRFEEFHLTAEPTLNKPFILHGFTSMPMAWSPRSAH